MSSAKVLRFKKFGRSRLPAASGASGGRNTFFDSLVANDVHFQVNIWKTQGLNWSVFTLDMVDESSGETYWVHKPDFWVLTIANKDRIESELVDKVPDVLVEMSSGYRCATPGGPNEISTFRTSSAKSIQRGFFMV